MALLPVRRSVDRGGNPGHDGGDHELDYAAEDDEAGHIVVDVAAYQLFDEDGRDTDRHPDRGGPDGGEKPHGPEPSDQRGGTEGGERDQHAVFTRKNVATGPDEEEERIHDREGYQRGNRGSSIGFGARARSGGWLGLHTNGSFVKEAGIDAGFGGGTGELLSVNGGFVLRLKTGREIDEGVALGGRKTHRFRSLVALHVQSIENRGRLGDLGPRL